MHFWRLASEEPGLFRADDLSGEGARRYGARWNPKGLAAVYASYHLATAVLESLVHLGRRKQPANRYVVRIEVDDAVLSDSTVGIVVFGAADLPSDWDANPPLYASQRFGEEQFRRNRIGFAVPSVVVQEELNLVLNPAHPAFRKAVKAKIVRSFAFDQRL
jgi:RES domain-containing protein